MSISQSTIKFISGLQRKKFRQNYHKFTAEGTKIVGELLVQERYLIQNLYATRDWLAENFPGYQSSNAENKLKTDLPATGSPADWRQNPLITEVSETELKRISALSTPNQVLAVVDMVGAGLSAPSPEIEHCYFDSQKEATENWSLYLDGLQSPANLGAILRVADWFGFQQVFTGPGTVDLYNPKSIQATMGCFLRLDFQEAELADIKAAHPDLPVFAADLEGENIYTFTAPSGGLLVIGNEGKGIRPQTRVLVDQYLRIPRGAGRQAESLNAAVAAGVLCGSLVR